MRSYPIASDLSLQVLQQRLRTRELGPPQLNDQNRQRFGLPVQIVREAVAADRIVSMSEDEWRVHRLQRRQRQLA